MAEKWRRPQCQNTRSHTRTRTHPATDKHRHTHSQPSSCVHAESQRFAVLSRWRNKNVAVEPQIQQYISLSSFERTFIRKVCWSTHFSLCCCCRQRCCCCCCCAFFQCQRQHSPFFPYIHSIFEQMIDIMVVLWSTCKSMPIFFISLSLSLCPARVFSA